MKTVYHNFRQIDIFIDRINKAGMDVMATYTINYFTVIFRSVDGTVLSTQTVPYGGIAQPPAVPDRPGYTFVGWDVNYSNISENLIALAMFVPDTGENHGSSTVGYISLLMAATLAILFHRKKRTDHY